MTPIPYVFLKDNCRAAVTAYGEIFGTPPSIMSFGDMPDNEKANMPGVPDDMVMHAEVAVGGGKIYVSDDPSGQAPAMDGCNIAVELEGEAETRRVWDALADGAKINMDLSPTFWTPLFGTLTDRFGVRWMIMQAYEGPEG